MQVYVESYVCVYMCVHAYERACLCPRILQTPNTASHANTSLVLMYLSRRGQS
jgi:hypothetical protein